MRLAGSANGWRARACGEAPAASRRSMWLSPGKHCRKVLIVVFEECRPLKMACKRLPRLLTGSEPVTGKVRLMY